MIDPPQSPKVTTIESILEYVVMHCYGNIWFDYKEETKNPVLAEAKAALEQLLIEARFNELQGLLDAYHTGAHPYDYINDRIKDLNNKAKGE